MFMVGGGNYLEYESLTTWAQPCHAAKEHPLWCLRPADRLRVCRAAGRAGAPQRSVT